MRNVVAQQPDIFLAVERVDQSLLHLNLQLSTCYRGMAADSQGRACCFPFLFLNACTTLFHIQSDFAMA